MILCFSTAPSRLAFKNRPCPGFTQDLLGLPSLIQKSWGGSPDAHWTFLHSSPGDSKCAFMVENQCARVFPNNSVNEKFLLEYLREGSWQSNFLANFNRSIDNEILGHTIWCNSWAVRMRDCLPSTYLPTPDHKTFVPGAYITGGNAFLRSQSLWSPELFISIST